MTATDRLAAYIDGSPSPYHAVASSAALLAAAGATEVAETDGWADVAGSGFLRRGGALVGWHLPDAWSPVDGFTVIGAHTDSPNLRIKARPDTGRAGWRQLGVEVYGGVLLNSWLDRDLGLSGRVAVRDGGGTAMRLLHVDRPLLRVAQLAIHLDRDVNSGLELDRQQHLVPVWGLGDATDGDFGDFVAAELGVAPTDVVSWDVMTHDLTPSARLGRDGELLAAPRIDNLGSCHAVTEALAAVTADGEASTASVVVLFDHEEIGSASATGAVAPLLSSVLERLAAARGADRDGFHRALAASWCVSADGAHAVHPNYLDRYEPDHLVQVNAGPVLKLNANVRYASDAATIAAFRLACESADVPTQSYIHRTNLACGSTIGPLTAANLGIPTVDVGMAQLSMHSARELMGAHDPELFGRALTAVARGVGGPPTVNP